MALFVSTFVNRIDKKGRISVPASFRASATAQGLAGIVAYRSFTAPCIEGMGLSRLEQMSEATDRLDAFSAEQDDLTNLIFADARQLAFDSEGRIVLPEDLVAHAQLTDRAAFVGRGKTFQIWEPESFAARQDEARRRALEQRPTLPLPQPGRGEGA